MNRPPHVCSDIEPDLVASATGDADSLTTERVERHIGRCAPCAGEYRRYRALEGVVDAIRRVPAPVAAAGRARQRLEASLHDLRRRTITYRIFPSPLGQILIAQSEQGVSLVEYLGSRTDVRHSRLAQTRGMEAIEDGAEVEALYRELMEYLEGKRTRLDWPLDLRLVRSDFHRHVLSATSEIPYGAVTSYAGLACQVGKPTAARAVAQALRWNPLPIVIPCHRVVGTSGALTGYAGDKIGLKQQLLTTEGIRTQKAGIPRKSMYISIPNETFYCLPSCSWIPTAEHPHRFIFFGTRERAEASGRTACGDCRPDLHPLTN
jgi:methylated-DNA-[protein]-cysteine S-methyltransferase